MNSSPRVSVCRCRRQCRRQHCGRGSCQHLARKDLQRQMAAGQMKSSVQPVRATSSDAKGGQRDMEQHSGVWSSAVSAVVWSLTPLYLESGALHPLGLLISDLAPLVASGEFAQGPTLQTWLFGSRVQISLVCLFAACVCSDLGSFPL